MHGAALEAAQQGKKNGLSNTVFVLGAGASRFAGAPLMKDFLDKAHDLWQLNAVAESAPCFKLVFEAIAALQAVHSKSQLDLDNIESVFTTCEMAKTLGRFPGEAGKDIDGLIRALKVVIVKTLELTVQFPCEDGTIKGPPPYDAFVSLLRRLKRQTKPSHNVSIITFNYDIALDHALYVGGAVADYGLGEQVQTVVDVVPLLKLHGSLNWSETSPTVAEKAVVPWTMGDYWQARRVRSDLSQFKTCTVPIGSQLIERSSKHGSFVTAEAVLVPPTWNKGEAHRALSKVWRRAACALSEAENIFVVGYSMPETDAFFRYLYALGTVGQTLLKRFWVFDIDTTGTVKQRFQNLLGPGAKARFRYFEKSFVQGIEELVKAFPAAP